MTTHAKIAAVLTVAGMIFFQTYGWTGEYTDKDYHSDQGHVYKHPNQGSFTGPFDYGAKTELAPRMEEARCNCFMFDATKSSDPEKQKLSYLWNFGDGQTSDEPVVRHCYDKAGDYNVTLTVKDSSGMVCDTGSTNAKVSANFPPTAVVGDVKACAGEAVTLDGSSSTGSGSLSYKWEFGDGATGEGVKTTHAYEKPGKYRVNLVVNDGKNSTCSAAVASAEATIGEKTSADLKGPEAVCVGRTAGFDAQVSGASKVHWDFGDGATWDGGSGASHAYSKSGEYTVSVTADNGQGFPCSVAASSVKIKVSGAPTADAGQNLACCVDKATSFDGSKSASADGSPLSYHWDFGDGATADTARATHAYEKYGTYRVVLTVKDSSGSACGTAVSSFVAHVNAQPQAVIEVK